MPIYPYSFQLPPLNVQDIPNDGAPGEFLGINGSGQLDWLTAGGGGSGDLLAANNLSELTNFATARTNIGLGTASTPTFANLTLTSPSLSSSAPVTISQTWGTTGTYTAFKVVANETATANTLSNVLELWSGNAATLKLSIRKSGQIVGPSGTIAAPTYGFADTDWGTGFSGWYRLGTGVACSTAGGTISAFSITHTNIRIGTSIPFGWTSGTAENALDTILLRDGAANTLALRNGAGVPQTFRVYNTFLGTTANEWFEIDWKTSAGTVRLFTMHGGTGVARNIDISAGGTLYFGAGTSSPIRMYSNGVERWNISATGHFITAADNTYDIGASGANRPRNLYVGSNIYAAGNVGIGTTAPSTKLEVAGTFISQNFVTVQRVGGSSQVIAMYARGAGDISNIGNPLGNGVAELSTNAPGLVIGVTGASPMVLGTNNLERVRISDTGNVGIGTTSPTSNLTVAQSTTGVGTISVGAAGTTVTGVGTQFLNTFAVGQTITSAGQTLTISAIASDTSMTISPAAGAAISGQAYTLVGGTRFTVAGNGKVGIGANVFLERDGDNLLALRNGTAAQVFNVYNTYTNASNYERGGMAWIGGALHVGVLGTAGTGSPTRALQFVVNNGAAVWNISTGGHFLTNGDNAYDIGASGASRPRDIHAGGNGIFGGLISALNGFRAPSSSQLIASANGIWRLTNSNADDFNRLQFGGTTNLFPAVKRSSTTLQARLADDSAFAPIQGKLTTDTAFTATTVTPTGFITLYDSTGTAYKVPCVPA